eukprot:TRINITY_DN19167_c0_g1_i1.p1 TRINITY_DN19167_c0_g1~~TRINITY_DN19167_c0_g1_i1.p1  ORF type:complete len:178 (-),score=9.97 TRINITY_DN19167_c0_g1_i1:445-978(-)
MTHPQAVPAHGGPPSQGPNSVQRMRGSSIGSAFSCAGADVEQRTEGMALSVYEYQRCTNGIWSGQGDFNRWSDARRVMKHGSSQQNAPRIEAMPLGYTWAESCPSWVVEPWSYTERPDETHWMWEQAYNLHKSAFKPSWRRRKWSRGMACRTDFRIGPGSSKPCVPCRANCTACTIQ